MFYANMHTISPGCSFWAIMFGQSFQITSFLVRRVLGMPRLDVYLHFFLPKVQSLTPKKLLSILVSLYGAHRELSAYIPLVGFSMLAWILGIFLTYSFYPSFHHAEIR